MHKFIICLILLSGGLTSGLAQAQTRSVVVDESRVEDWAEKNQSALRFPSLALGIVDRNGTRAQAVLGGESNQAFLIGSLSKSVTALSVMLLVEDGELALDAPVRDFYEGVPAGITVEMLLHQTSGLTRGEGGDAWTSDATLDEMIADASWGTTGEFAYSNLNAQILGGIIEEVSGQSYASFVETRVFEPLALENSSAAAQRPERRVMGHQYFYGFPVQTGERTYNPVAVPAGFVWMSPGDMAKYLQIFVNAGKVGDRQIFPSQTIEKLLEKPEGSRYAMGWMVARHESAYRAHSGATSSFTSAMAVIPGEWGVYALSNLNTYNAEGTVTAMEGLLAMLDVIEPRAAGNAEFVLRLVAGTLTLLFLLALVWRVIQWFRQGFPLRIMPSKRLALAFTLVIVGGVMLYIVFGVRAPLLLIALTQPDLFTTFVTFTAGVVVWQFTVATLASVVYYAED